MNIFFLDRNVDAAAKAMCDKHVVKMIVESAQMLSTAHRVLDGAPVAVTTAEGRKKKFLLLLGESLRVDGGKFVITARDGVTLYKATHANHPSNVWTRSGKKQYEWHAQLLHAMMREYTKRYSKIHATERLMVKLDKHPVNIPRIAWSDPPLAMPDKYKTEDHVEAYRQFYSAEKARFARWKNGSPPEWFRPNESHLRAELETA